MYLVKALLLFIIAACVSSVSILCLWVDIDVLHNALTEYSVTEIVQELVLFIIAALWLRDARRSAQGRQRNVLIAGFFLTMLFRELDALFDYFAHGSWIWLALLTAAFCLTYSMRHLRATLNQLALYVRHPSYGIMLCGLLAILVFSRLFGMHQLWQDIMQGGYVRLVKNIVEEGSELFGYMLCLVATLAFIFDKRPTDLRY